MTFIYETVLEKDLDIPKMHLRKKMKFLY